MEEVKLCKSFKLLNAGLEKIVNKQLKEKGLSFTQGLALLWLDEEEDKELPIKVIEKRFGTAQSTTLGVINRLEQKGLVSTYFLDHRTKMVQITQGGLCHIPCIKSHIRETDEGFFRHFTPGERVLFLELLKKAEDNLLQQHDIEMRDYDE